MLLNYKTTGQGEPIVLVHGMASSLNYWDDFVPLISSNHQVIRIDLLGYGRSPMPSDISYNYDTQIQSIIETLDHIGIDSFILFGYSMGALIALRLAAEHSTRVKKLILLAPSIHKDAATAKRRFTGGSRIKEMAYYGTTSRTLCTTWCRLLRPISKHIAPFYLTHIPKKVARDSVLHTWQSYDQSLHNILMHQDVAGDLVRVKASTLIIYGDKDTSADPAQVIDPKTISNLRVLKLPGTHQIIFEHPQQIARLI